MANQQKYVNEMVNVYPHPYVQSSFFDSKRDVDRKEHGYSVTMSMSILVCSLFTSTATKKTQPVDFAVL